MIILGIETSCDETAVCVVEATGDLRSPFFSVLGNGLFSQVALHAPYGGVYPTIAKREHARNLPSLLQKALTEAGLFSVLDKSNSSYPSYSPLLWQKAKEILSKEDGLLETFTELVSPLKRPNIDLITVTVGPGLEPALWVGISFAHALSVLWDIPVQAVNHMEGHITSVLLKTGEIKNNTSPTPDFHLQTSTPIQFPTLALLISGGHTELVSIEHWGKYRKIGQTRDDAVGEAFDKVARMLSLPYPGGPEVSRKAEKARTEHTPKTFTLPRPMIHSKDFDFSFSGLKTAVLYTLKEHASLTEEMLCDMCREFEDAVTEVFLTKTKKALEEVGAHTLIIAGGVVANTHIRKAFGEMISHEFPEVTLCIPEKEHATDNALMIATAGYIEHLLHPKETRSLLKADGNMSF
ncbi:MAG: tRNA (adenosine(37)-N6)-threonylcarbamoyltransferase complex transferase subunit TsaD [Candidatus Zambryskibacteria bacterium]|nr:tRNA (adenosine(37)-N6)-threonylcarbamoyltransferase complex transferase subunit TsaD [Candidatus Zambryskibacteria bacterium]